MSAFRGALQCELRRIEVMCLKIRRFRTFREAILDESIKNDISGDIDYLMHCIHTASVAKMQHDAAQNQLRELSASSSEIATALPARCCDIRSRGGAVAPPLHSRLSGSSHGSKSEEGTLVNLGELIEFAAIVSSHSPNLIDRSEPLPEQALERYLHWSELRAEEWSSALAALPTEISAAPAAQRAALWLKAQPTFFDVFAGSLVARVWGAVLTACDRQRKTLSAEKTARTALASHDQVQQQILRLMVDGPYLTLERVVALDRIRRKIERWSDLLVGHIVRRYGVSDFTYDADRALDFGDEQLQQNRGARQDQVWDMYFLCLRSAFPDTVLPDGIQGERRNEILKSILNSLPERLFLSDGMMASVVLARLLAGDTVNEGPPTRDDVTAPIIKWPDVFRGSHRRIERRGWNFKD
jgi:hypothetical protein